MRGGRRHAPLDAPSAARGAIVVAPPRVTDDYEALPGDDSGFRALRVTKIIPITVDRRIRIVPKAEPEGDA